MTEAQLLAFTATAVRLALVLPVWALLVALLARWMKRCAE